MTMSPKAAARLAWSIAILSIALLLAALVMMFVDRNAAVPGPRLWTLSNVLENAVPIGVPIVGGVLASRRPENAIGWLFLAAGFFVALSEFGLPLGEWILTENSGPVPLGRTAAWLGNWMWILSFIALAFVFLLFPTGHLPSRRWRPVAWFTAFASVLLAAIPLVGASRVWSDPFTASASSGLLGPAFVAVLVVVLGPPLVAVIVRFRRSSGDERLQMKWFATSTVFVVLGAVLVNVSASVVCSAVFSLAIVFFVASIAIAVLRYRLYEIDVVINKAVIYGVLAAFFTVVYVAVVVGIGTAVGSAHNPFLTLLAAGVIALAFNPVRDRAKRWANRIAYGRRATPYDVLSEFAVKMASTYSLEDVLPRTARMLAEGTGATRADVWLLVGSLLVDEGTWPDVNRLESVPTSGAAIDIPGASRAVAVRHQGELLGALSIHKAAGDPVTSVEDKLLSDVASQAGLVLRNVGLIEDLRASRQRIVAAQDEERRRLERNIHDGAQQQLVALSLKAKLARQLIGRDDEKARSLIEEVTSDSTDALENLRDLARGIYPPLLADQGLAAALGAQVRKSPVPTTVDSDGIGRYQQEAEAAVYFCTLEALQNVAKYARASRAVVRLAAPDGQLVFRVEDDGVGFDPSAKGYGTGMQGMSDRLAALGGDLRVTSEPGTGTVVEGRVPAERPG